jgi:hypothetical protein
MRSSPRRVVHLPPLRRGHDLDVTSAVFVMVALLTLVVVVVAIYLY